MAEPVDLRESRTPMTFDRSAWIRLGQLVRARRTELGLGIREAAALTHEGGGRGFSDQTWSSIEKAKITNRRPSNLDALCRVLGWRPGSVEAILRGGDPTPAAIDIRDLASTKERIEAAKARLQEVMDVLDECLQGPVSQADL